MYKSALFIFPIVLLFCGNKNIINNNGNNHGKCLVPAIKVTVSNTKVS